MTNSTAMQQQMNDLGFEKHGLQQQCLAPHAILRSVDTFKQVGFTHKKLVATTRVAKQTLHDKAIINDSCNTKEHEGLPQVDAMKMHIEEMKHQTAIYA